MTETFLQHLKPFLVYSNLLGLTYILVDRTKSVFEVFMGVPIALLYGSCVYGYTAELFRGDTQQLSQISKIVDPLEFIVFVLTFLMKWTYYFFKRHETKRVIFEVFCSFENC